MLQGIDIYNKENNFVKNIIRRKLLCIVNIINWNLNSNGIVH